MQVAQNEINTLFALRKEIAANVLFVAIRIGRQIDRRLDTELRSALFNSLAKKQQPGQSQASSCAGAGFPAVFLARRQHRASLL